MQPTIVDMTTLSQAQRLEAATILRTALAWADDAYGAPGEAEAEVAATIESEDRHGLAALEGERVLGWIGAIESYSHAWELHPLVVMPGRQRQGVGGRLTAALEAKAAAAGVLTIFLGTDDVAGGTSLHGRELFPGLLGAAAQIAPRGGHPFTFYQRQGYEVSGVIPHANGFGRPDILMAKRIG
ncbi:MAG TPA: GNAT family N-acetyltransferase [Phenylobacterium sp.]